MQSWNWVASNWPEILNAIGIIGSLCFTGYSLHSEAKTRRIANLIALTASHRDIWKQMVENPSLRRVIDPQADTLRARITVQERMFVTMVIQHLGVVFDAMRDDLTIKPEGLKADVQQFMTLPIPASVWKEIKALQDNGFVAFVDEDKSLHESTHC